MDELKWQFSSFSDLSVFQLYQILAARQSVFNVEQDCAFQDADGLDIHAWHLSGWVGETCAAYARIVPPGIRFEEPSIGRVITNIQMRGRGYGKLLMTESIKKIELLYPNSDIKISAQLYLENFYNYFGFRRISNPYDEDNIMHIDMIRPNK